MPNIFLYWNIPACLQSHIIVVRCVLSVHYNITFYPVYASNSRKIFVKKQIVYSSALIISKL